jgi:hypothetical protein
MKQRLVPRQMHGISRLLPPRRPGFSEESQTLACPPLHLQDMRDDMDGPGVSGIEGKSPPRRPLGPPILAVLLEAEGVHRKHAWIGARLGAPFGQDLSNAVAQHPAPPETEVKRVGNRERDDVARPIDDNRAVAFERRSRAAIEPGARGRCVAARRIAPVGKRPLKAKGKDGLMRLNAGLIREQGKKRERSLRVTHEPAPACASYAAIRGLPEKTDHELAGLLASMAILETLEVAVVLSAAS